MFKVSWTDGSFFWISFIKIIKIVCSVILMDIHVARIWILINIYVCSEYLLYTFMYIIFWNWAQIDATALNKFQNILHNNYTLYV